MIRSLLGCVALTFSLTSCVKSWSPAAGAVTVASPSADSPVKVYCDPHFGGAFACDAMRPVGSVWKGEALSLQEGVPSSERPHRLLGYLDDTFSSRAQLEAQVRARGGNAGVRVPKASSPHRWAVLVLGSPATDKNPTAEALLKNALPPSRSGYVATGAANAAALDSSIVSTLDLVRGDCAVAAFALESDAQWNEVFEAGAGAVVFQRREVPAERVAMFESADPPQFRWHTEVQPTWPVPRFGWVDVGCAREAQGVEVSLRPSVDSTRPWAKAPLGSGSVKVQWFVKKVDPQPFLQAERAWTAMHERAIERTQAQTEEETNRACRTCMPLSPQCITRGSCKAAERCLSQSWAHPSVSTCLEVLTKP